jgi:ADP-heptose:LPS heptosyltransferase
VNPGRRSLKAVARKILPSFIVAWVESILWISRNYKHAAPEFLCYITLFVRYCVNVRIKRRRLVVVERSGGIGDLICMLACLPGLRESHTKAWLAVITPVGCRQLAKASGLCDAASETHSMSHRFLRQVCCPNSYFQPLLPDERNPPERSQLRLAEEFARVLGTFAKLDSVRFRIPTRARHRVIQHLRAINPDGRPIVVVHLGPSWPVKEWPKERWSELAEKISLKGSVVIRIGTDVDSSGRHVPRTSIVNTVDWIGTRSLIDTVALLERADVFIGIDSGPLHIATTLGVPSVGLFGPTDGRLIVHARAESIIVTGTASCLGCHHASPRPLHWRTGCPNDIVCMREITCDQVLDAVSKAQVSSSRDRTWVSPCWSAAVEAPARRA